MTTSTKTAPLVAPETAENRRRNEAARRLLQAWREDDSGYDEQAWPQAKRLLEENRLSARSRFGD